MLDVPVPVYIEYKNLSPVVSQAEHQKDLITSIIKKIEGQTKLILEHSQSFQNSQDDRFSQKQMTPIFLWEVKCVVCYNVIEENSEIILSSVKKELKNDGENSEIYFDTVDQLGKISSWKIELAEVKPIIVHSGKSVKINFNSENGIAIQSSGKALKNATQGEVIRVQVNSWFNKNNNNYNPALNPISTSTEIIEAKVVAPNEVEYVGKQ